VDLRNLEREALGMSTWWSLNLKKLFTYVEMNLSKKNFNLASLTRSKRYFLKVLRLRPDPDGEASMGGKKRSSQVIIKHRPPPAVVFINKGGLSEGPNFFTGNAHTLPTWPFEISP